MRLRKSDFEEDLETLLDLAENIGNLLHGLRKYGEHDDDYQEYTEFVKPEFEELKATFIAKYKPKLSNPVVGF